VLAKEKRLRDVMGNPPTTDADHTKAQAADRIHR